MNEKPKPSAQPGTVGQIDSIAAGGAEPLRGKIEIVDYDPGWPLQFTCEAERIRAVLGSSALAIEHTGSTSVAGLAAKPIIDIVLTVTDSAREETYAPAIVSAGYRLAIREPEWFEHRLFKRTEPVVNLHVFSDGCSEVARMKLFRDWLRSNAADRILYEQTKRSLAERDWSFVQNYADAKTEVITQIVARAQAWAARLQPDPRIGADRESR
jgi:GrpB-like predicted nucleotidyltransferase (UPF0157 family)